MPDGTPDSCAPFIADDAVDRPSPPTLALPANGGKQPVLVLNERGLYFGERALGRVRTGKGAWIPATSVRGRKEEGGAGGALDLWTRPGLGSRPAGFRSVAENWTARRSGFCSTVIFFNSFS